jgi:hypothetical protein
MLYYYDQIYGLNDTNNEAVLVFVFWKIQFNACECESFTWNISESDGLRRVCFVISIVVLANNDVAWLNKYIARSCATSTAPSSIALERKWPIDLTI